MPRRQLSPQPWRFQDPRWSSTHSLLPTDELPYAAGARSGDCLSSIDNKSSTSVAASAPLLAPSTGHGAPPRNRRTLLIIYIHGFLGDTTSFKSFPAHVHGYLTQRLQETHVVHTKLYPRYKSYVPLPTAREDLSNWLAPHLENDGTGEKDVVFVGHSMGGMVAAEVVLLPALNSRSGHPLRHRILGHISCDSPFFSLHPNIVVTGLKSLMPGKKVFEEEIENPNAQSPYDSPNLSHCSSETPSPLPFPYLGPAAQSSPSLYHHESPSQTPLNLTPIPSTSSSASFSTASTDPTFNPPFWNDVTYPSRGIWRTLAHLSKKCNYRPGAIASATLQRMSENATAAACLLDYPNLRKRYKSIRELENESNRRRVRVRWANFYTVCSGERKVGTTPDLRNENERPALRPRRREMATMLKESEVKRGMGKGTVLGSGEVEGGASFGYGNRGIHRITRVEEDREAISLHVTGEAGDATPKISVSDWSLYSSTEIDGAAGLSDWYESEVEESDSDSDGNGSLVENGGKSMGMVNVRMPAPTRPAPAPPTTSASSLDIINRDLSPSRSPHPAEPKSPTPSKLRTPPRTPQSLQESQRALSMGQAEGQFEYEMDTNIRLDLARSELEAVTRGRQRCDIQNSGEIWRLENLVRDLEAQPPSSSNSTSSRVGASEKGIYAEPKLPFSKPAGKSKGKKQAKQRERKFCLIPPGTETDNAWIKVDMGEVDEVAAHCGLFDSERAHYRDFLGAFCQRIVEWVEADVAARTVTKRGE